MYRSAKSQKIIQHIVNSVGSGEEIRQRKEISLFVLINSYIHIFYNKTIYMHYYVPQHLSPWTYFYFIFFNFILFLNFTKLY